MDSSGATSSSLDTSTEEVEECTVTSGLLTTISTGQTETETLIIAVTTSTTPRYSDTEWNHHAAAAAVAATAVIRGVWCIYPRDLFSFNL